MLRLEGFSFVCSQLSIHVGMVIYAKPLGIRILIKVLGSIISIGVYPCENYLLRFLVEY